MYSRWQLLINTWFKTDNDVLVLSFWVIIWIMLLTSPSFYPSEPDVGMLQGSAQKYFRQLIKGVVCTASILIQPHLDCELEETWSLLVVPGSNLCTQSDSIPKHAVLDQSCDACNRLRTASRNKLRLLFKCAFSL